MTPVSENQNLESKVFLRPAIRRLLPVATTAGFLVIGMVMTTVAQAQIYKCKSPGGQIQYSQTPCADEEEQAATNFINRARSQARRDRSQNLPSRTSPPGATVVDNNYKSPNRAAQARAGFSDELCADLKKQIDDWRNNGMQGPDGNGGFRRYSPSEMAPAIKRQQQGYRQRCT